MATTTEDTQTSGHDLEEINTEDEMATDTSKWSEKERKKLKHMTAFHEEYQRVFGNKASLHTIIRKRTAHMNPPIPSSVCKEEMRDANVDTNEVIIEYITDAQGNKVKKLKPLFIKSEPNKVYVQHIPSDDELPAVPESNSLQKCEITVDSYSESISSNATGLQSAANGYLALASHLPNLSPYELPQIVAQIPPPPMNIPMPI